MSARVFFVTGGVLLGMFLLVLGARTLVRGQVTAIPTPTPVPTATGFAIVITPPLSLVSGHLEVPRTPIATSSAIVASTQSPTSAATPATPAPTVLIQAEWPLSMAEGNSDTVVVSLIQTRDGLSVAQVEEAGQTAVPATLVPRGTPGVPYAQAYGPGYKLTAASAILSATNIDVIAVSDSVQPYPLDENRLSWLWNISPRKQGKQAMTADVRFRWESDTGEPPKEQSVWQYTLDTQVGPPEQVGAVVIEGPSSLSTQSSDQPADPVGFWADALSLVTGLGAVFAFVGGAVRWGLSRAKGLVP